MLRYFNRYNRSLLLFLLLFLCTNLWAQQENWNRVLDQYEQICDQCITLRRNVEKGVLVPTQSLTDLLSQLRSLRTRIQNAGGSMTKAQTDRFNRIRQKYDEAFGITSPAATTTPATTQRNAPNRQQVNTTPPPEKPVIKEEPEKEIQIQKDTVYLTITVPVDEPRTLSKTVNDIYADFTPSQVDSQEESRNPFLTSDHSSKRDARFMVLGQWQMDYRNAFGLFLAYTPGRWGAYASVRTNLVSAYDESNALPILDEGANGTAGFFPSGRNRYSLTSLNLGAVYKLNPYLSFYLGAGLTSRHYQWEDIDGSWAPLESHTGKFMAIDMGVIGSYKRLSLGAGLQYSKRASMVLSLGVNF